MTTDLIVQGNYVLIPYLDRSGVLAKPLRFVGLVFIGWVMFEIFRLRREVTGLKKAQLNYFSHGVLIFSAGGALLAGILQLFGGLGLEPGLASYFSLPWVAMTFYAITRYRLFDIRIIISRTVTISLLASFFSLIQIGFFAILAPLAGDAWTIVISLFFIGFLFFSTPFTRHIQTWVQQLVLQNKYDYQQILKDSSKAIMTILHLHELLQYLMNSIKSSLGVEHACLFLRGPDGLYIREHGFGHAASCSQEILDGSIVARLKRTGQVIIREELERTLPEQEFSDISTHMKKADVELFMPLSYKGVLQGILSLGRKGNLDAYADSDLVLLEALAGHAAVAIENARLYEESRRVQESLRESQERFRNLIETTSDWVWEMNDRGMYTYVSPKIRDILGHEPDEVLGKTFFDFMPREEARRAADFFVSLTRHKRPFMMYQNTYLHKTGRIVVIETSGVPVFGQDGCFTGYRGIDRDVTQRNQLEGKLRYAQKMEAVGRLSAGVAHDFNNINTAIVGYANLLYLKLAKDDPNREHVDQILEATERSAGLTRCLLAFSKKQTADLRPVNLNELINRTERLMAGLVREDIELRLDLNGDDLMIAADEIQIERVLMNLAANARDAMPKGGRLTVETREAGIDDAFIAANGFGKEGAYALITVTDTGTGMDERIMKKIFEPFFTTKGVGKGTGFGLSIVYDIVKQHRGYITVASSPGRGSSFMVYVPLLQRSGEAVRQAASAPAIRMNGTVLVADNNEQDRKFIKAVLEGQGYRVIEATDGEDAVQKYMVHHESVYAVILDVIMPKMNGKEAYRQITSRRPDARVLFTSSYPEDLVLQKGMLDAPLSLLLKPFSSQELLERMRVFQPFATRPPSAL
jgi:PAS domain S-box-containing protein